MGGGLLALPQSASPKDQLITARSAISLAEGKFHCVPRDFTRPQADFIAKENYPLRMVFFRLGGSGFFIGMIY